MAPGNDYSGYLGWEMNTGDSTNFKLTCISFILPVILLSSDEYFQKGKKGGGAALEDKKRAGGPLGWLSG